LQNEAFGQVCLLVLAESEEQMLQVAHALEGNLTGTIYSDTAGSDDAQYDVIAPVLRTRVGRLINDRMPTGVAVSPAQNHGGPYPGLAAALFRIAQLRQRAPAPAAAGAARCQSHRHPVAPGGWQVDHRRRMR